MSGVCKVYVLDQQGGAIRAIAHESGEVFTPTMGWHRPATTVQVIAASPTVYENWADVPEAWLGVVPYWSARS